MWTLSPIRAFQNNYIWLFQNGLEAWVVDPGEPASVLDYLHFHGLQLRGIFITHHHADHIGGVRHLCEATGTAVFGPATEMAGHSFHRLSEGARVSALGIEFRVLDVPGHTAGHIAYYSPDFDGTPLLFCGDALFSAGCGRLFEGTPEQMLRSLDKLAALPGPTRICCAHEYTLGNLKFALAVDPDNEDIAANIKHCEALLAEGLPTVPSSIEKELRINPFLRSRHAAIKKAVRRFHPDAFNEVEIFAALRAWKDRF
ncbi:hydroxyacylglutathione hydrolase [Azohydromonas lata]|uniref:hydroxyacylglutathione hydrolase n=1 Tax=Azohydromonas lata TaxID=45677 RepID=UPI000830DFF6|nr:hydroxyacylglutathione hydrolase [Azohydromonas lata]